MEKETLQYVKGPQHMKKIIECTFGQDIYSATTKTPFAGFVWLIYIGLTIDEACALRGGDVDLSSGSISLKSGRYTIPQEAMEIFSILKTSTTLIYKNANYQNDINRKRVDGNLLLRGVRGNPASNSFMIYARRKMRDAFLNGACETRTTLDKVYMSGVFWRAYCAELAGERSTSNFRVRDIVTGEESECAYNRNKRYYYNREYKNGSSNLVVIKCCKKKRRSAERLFFLYVKENSMEEIIQEQEVIESMPLIKKLAKIRKMSDAVVKEKSGYNYKYADITTILAKVTTGQSIYHVSLIPEVVPGTFHVEKNEIVKTRMSRDGKPYGEKKVEMLFTAQMNYMWVNDDDPTDVIIVPWVLTGSQEDPSRAFGSAITYCTRYFLTTYFQIAQPETDVDAYRTKQKQAEDEENKAVVASIVERIDTSVKGYLANNADKRTGNIRASSALIASGRGYG